MTLKQIERWWEERKKEGKNSEAVLIYKNVIGKITAVEALYRDLNIDEEE